MEFERRVSGKFVSKVFAEVEGPLALSLLKAGLDVMSPGAEVPIEQFSSGLTLYSQLRFPNVSRSEALRRVGYETVRRNKKLGGSLSDAMEVLPGKLSNIALFLEPQVHTHGDHFVAHFTDVASLHTFFLGLLEGVTSSTDESVRVVWRPEGLSGARYEMLHVSAEQRLAS